MFLKNTHKWLRIKQKLCHFLVFVFSVMPIVVFGQGTGALPNPLGPGVNTLSEFVVKLLRAVVGIGGVISVFFLIYAGFLFVKASGNEEAIKTAKKTFSWTCLGIMILLGAEVLARIIIDTIKQVEGGT